MTLARFKSFHNKSYILLVCILLLTLLLYGYQLGTESLWFDEAYSLESAQGPLNLNRPLYFLLLRLWMQVNQGEAWLRSLSALWGLISIGLMYQLGKRLSTPRTGLLAALFLALSPLAINHAQEVRFYTMSNALGLSGSLCLIHFLETRTVNMLSGWILLRLLAILTAQVNLLLLLPDVLLIALQRRSSQPISVKSLHSLLRKRGWLLLLFALPMAVVLKDVIPPLLDFAAQAPTLNGVAVSRPGIVNVIGAFATFTAWPLRAPRTEWTGFYQPFYKVYALVVVGLLVYGLYHHRSTRIGWAAVWGFGSVLLIFAAGQLSVGMWGDRYLFMAAPYCLLVLAAGIAELWQRRRVIAIAVIVLYGIAVGSALFRYYTVLYRHDWRGLAHTIQQQQRPADRIAIYPGFFQSPFAYYYRNGITPDIIERQTERIDTERILNYLLISFQGQKDAKYRLWLIFPKYDDWDAQHQKVLDTLKKVGYRLQTQQTISSQWGEDVNLSIATKN
jgi:mannosyltransferase